MFSCCLLIEKMSHSSLRDRLAGQPRARGEAAAHGVQPDIFDSLRPDICLKVARA
jgi:hypothetical protein